MLRLLKSDTFLLRLLSFETLPDPQFMVYANFTSLAKTTSSILFHLIWLDVVILNPSEENTSMAKGCRQQNEEHNIIVFLDPHINI
jgi:hypothetical protein